MRGEEYLSGIGRLKLAECLVVLRGAYNKYFPSLFPVEEFGGEEITRTMGEAGQRGDGRVVKMSLDYFLLSDRCSGLDMGANPVFIGT